MGATLIELRVRNLGVIDDVTVALGPGMTALTGETGAGKTLLVEALSLLLGGRADPAMVRAGADEAMVEGRFTREPSTTDGSTGTEDPPPPGGAAAASTDAPEIVLARSVVRGGRSRAWVDGRMASVATLAEAAAGLLELHGQHQHQSLVHVEDQRQILDVFGHIDLGELEAARRELRRLTHEAESLGGDARQRAREVDLLRYQIEEIEGAAIEDRDEDGRLEVEEDRLAAAADHRHAAGVAMDAVSGPGDDSALDRLAQASVALGGHGPLEELERRLRSSMAELSDLASELRSVVETWDDDPERLEEVRARRQLLRQLVRKYGADLDEVVAFGADAGARLAAIERDELRAGALDAEIHAARSLLAAREDQVSRARREAAPGLAAQIEHTVHGLAMPSARFSIEVDGPGPADQVTFLLGANPGEPMQPLAKAASGGELARTMLAVRLATTDSPGVMVFDEVDSGVGGAAATAVGEALAGLGRHAQVLVVTHLAQVAALADQQIGVRKSEHGGRTWSEVDPLDAHARVVELSRMLSGHPDSATAQRHARELLGQEPTSRAR
jgi:DNA repair protein RecN (Recombination protein N)